MAFCLSREAYTRAAATRQRICNGLVGACGGGTKQKWPPAHADTGHKGGLGAQCIDILFGLLLLACGD